MPSIQETSQYIDWPLWPQYDEQHEEAVLRVIRSNQLFAAAEVAAFENEFRSHTGAAHTIGVGNATQGLQLALASLGIGYGDEVIVTPYSWISSASCVLMQNAIPVFVDIEPDSFGICPECLAKAITPRTKAVILVHMFGLCSKVDEIAEICNEHSIPLIEDGSHSHGATLRGKHLGTFGTIGVFSLHQRKAIAAGDGGIICTNDSQIAEKIRRLRSFGDKQLSYNYRMTEFAAAIARIGLHRLEEENRIRRRNHAILAQRLKGTKITVVEPAKDVEAVFYSNLLVINLSREQQEDLLAAVESVGIPLKRTWQPLHRHPHFQRDNMINKRAPWDYVYKDFKEPGLNILPVAENLQVNALFEMDGNPFVPASVMKKSADFICDKLNSY